jgi:hypothetical protein
MFSRQNEKLVLLFKSKKKDRLDNMQNSDTKYFVTFKCQDVFKYVFHILNIHI